MTFVKFVVNLASIKLEITATKLANIEARHVFFVTKTINNKSSFQLYFLMVKAII